MAGITPIQKKSLQWLLTLSPLGYYDIINASFTAAKIPLPKNLPSIDDLSYDEAKAIIKCNNKLVY